MRPRKRSPQKRMPAKASSSRFRPPAVVLLSHNQGLIDALKREGLRLIGLFDPMDASQLSAAQAKDYDERLNVTGYFALESLSAAAVHIATLGPAQVVCVREDLQMAAGLLRELLGQPGALKRAVQTRDKRAMKAALKGRAPVADFVSLPDNLGAAEAEALAQGLGWPLVIKPAAGAAVTNTYFLDGPADLARRLPLGRLKQYVQSHHRLLERRIEGTEHSVDALWQDGRPVYFHVFRYNLPVIIARGAGSPYVALSSVAPHLHPGLYTQARRLQAAVNRRLGLRDGLTHMEFFLEPSGRLVFGEIAHRMGGTYVRECLQRLFNEDPYDLLARMAAGKELPTLVPRRDLAVAVVLAAPPRAGMVLSVSTGEEARTWPGVLEARRLCWPGSLFAAQDVLESSFEMVLGAPDEAALQRLIPPTAGRLRVRIASPYAPWSLAMRIVRAWNYWRQGKLSWLHLKKKLAGR